MDPYEQVTKHSIRFHKPAPDFFEGALLGNGGLGVVVTTRPDAVVIHFGHNNVWDIRIAEDHEEEIGTFQEVFDRLLEFPTDIETLTDDPWYKEYCNMTQENYNKSYPRPMPCGSLLLRYDRRKAEVLGHTVHIANGLCEVDFRIGDKAAVLQLFVEKEHDRLWMRLIDTVTGEVCSLFESAALIPDPDTPKEFPASEATFIPEAGLLSFMQILPYTEHPVSNDERHPKDKAFKLNLHVTETIERMDKAAHFEAKLNDNKTFTAYVELNEGFYSDVAGMMPEASPHIPEAFEKARDNTIEEWKDYWRRSAVVLDDEFLERIWFWNLYFFNCSIKEGVTCPGLFANWNYRSIGSSWHGDYHMNYNTQQPFWLAFSSNHMDKHLPYVDMVDHVLPVSKKWAQNYYGLRGAYYPHSAYPVEMNMMPYPVPHWGWEICETPWTVQSLWWHYLYSMDEDFLRNRAFVPMLEAVLFMVDYMKRPEAHGDQWGDNKYHIFPTVVPELYEISPGFNKNSDCLVDLTLTKFLFNAFVKACDVLGENNEQAEILQDVTEILNNFPEYPTASSSKGTVFISVEGEDPETIYNVPNTITTVFPGEEHGLHSSEDEYNIAVNSYLNHRNEGGNELVFYHMAGARLGKLDLERFKRQVAYCQLPNGTCTDRVLLTGGRYPDTTNFDFMSRMGIWFENFSLPAVINECLLQSYTGILRFFPNWPRDKKAQFHTLRAVGSFLVSASIEGGEVKEIEILSEAGSTLAFYMPWKHGAVCESSFGEVVVTGEIGRFATTPGQILKIRGMFSS